MENLIYRAVKRKDHKLIKEELKKLWQLDTMSLNPRIIDKIVSCNFIHILRCADYAEAAICDEKTAGIFFARTSGKRDFFKNIYYLPAELYLSAMLKLSGEKIVSEYKKIENAFKTMYSQLNKKFDGEIILFLVSESFKRKGIGKNLIGRYEKKCIKNKIKKIFLFTDTHCNYEYYDKNGFKKECSKQFMITTLNGEVPHETYIYTKQLKG